MGIPGPPPTPTPILELRGSFRAKQRQKQGEAKGPPGRPTCPKWLPKEAKAAWRQLVPMLENMGVLTRIDAHALARYCVTWVRWKAAVKFLEEKGEVYTLKDPAGNIRCLQQFPQVGIASRLAHQLGQLEQEFGMSPSARSRINVQVPVPEVRSWDRAGGKRPLIVG